MLRTVLSYASRAVQLYLATAAAAINAHCLVCKPTVSDEYPAARFEVSLRPFPRSPYHKPLPVADFGNAEADANPSLRYTTVDGYFCHAGRICKADKRTEGLDGWWTRALPGDNATIRFSNRLRS